jgi:flagellar biosynthesis/type III secretory pathway protein FliH
MELLNQLEKELYIANSPLLPRIHKIMEEVKKALDDARQEGYENGYDDGATSGYDEGYVDGKEVSQ